MVHAPELALCDSPPGCVGDVFVGFFNGQQNYISLETGMRCVKDGEILASKH